MGKVFLWKYAVILLCVGGITYGHHHHHQRHPPPPPPHHHHHHHHHHEQPDEYDLPREVPTRGFRYLAPKVELKNFSGSKLVQRISESRAPASYRGYEEEYEPPMPPPPQYSRSECRCQREPVPTYAPPPRSRAYIEELPPVRSTCESCSECQEDDEYYTCPCARERGGSFNAGREVSYRPHVEVEQCPCACGDNSFMDCPCCSGGDCPYCSEGNCPCGGSCPSHDVEDDGDCPCCQRHGGTYTEECPCNCANEPESYVPRGRAYSTYQEFPPVSHMNERRGGYAPVPQMEEEEMYAPPPPPPPAYTQIPQPPVGQFRSVPMDDIPEVRRMVVQRPPMEMQMPPYEPPQPQRVQMQAPQTFMMKAQPELTMPPVGSRIISPEEPAPPQLLQTVTLPPNVPMSPPVMQSMRIPSDMPMAPPPVIQTMRIPAEGNMPLPPVIQTMRVPAEVTIQPPTNQPIQQIQRLPTQYVNLEENFPQNVQYGRPVIKEIPSSGRRSYMTPIINGRIKPSFLEGLSFSEGC